MNAIITRETVQDAVEKLKLAGKKPTHSAILATIGGGSATTLVQVLAQLREDAAAERDNQQAIRAFREFWPIVSEAARKQHNDEKDELQETIDFLAAEVQRLEGGSAAAAEAVATMESQCAALTRELTRANDRLTSTLTSAELSAKKELEAFAKTDAARNALERENNDLRERLNGREMELARTTEQVAAARASTDLHVSRLAEAAEKLESLRAAGAAENAKFAIQIANEQRRNQSLEIELARAQAMLENRQEKQESKGRGRKAVTRRGNTDGDSAPA